MGKHIKKFQSNSQRTTFENSQSYIEPYVSLVSEDDSVHYNKIEEAIVVTCRDLENDTVNFISPYHYFFFDQVKEKIEYIKIDGETILPENYSTYLTDTSHSTHTVKIKLKEEYKDTLPEYMFRGTDVISAFLPNTIEILGGDAFYECYNLSKVTLSKNLTDMGRNTFYRCTSLTNITIPNSLSSIGSYSFYGCSGLTLVTIPNSITEIKSGAFYNCTNLTSVTIPNSMTIIRNHAFLDCTSLASVTIPNSVTIIEYNAFNGCTGLENITIGNGITNIGNYAFQKDNNLTNITIEATTPPTLGNYPFDNYNAGYVILPNLSIYVPAESLAAYKSAWSRYSNIIFAAE